MKRCMSLSLSYQCCQNNSKMQNSTCKAHIAALLISIKYMNKTKICLFTEG